MHIYVGNLSYEITETELQELFEAFGSVDTVNIIKDRATGRPKGFGFVEMPEDEEASAAIEGLNEKEVKGRKINVNEAKPKKDNRSSERRRERVW